jgi:hypothetical protein
LIVVLNAGDVAGSTNALSTGLLQEFDMKRLINVSSLFGIIVLLMLMTAGNAGATAPRQEGPVGRRGPGGGGMWGPVAGGWAAGQEGLGEEAEGTALRINFESSHQYARKGIYVVRDLNGTVLATWQAQDGWRDSGWISNIDIDRKAVWVQVFYHPVPNAQPIIMKILNPAPDTQYGWISQGISHALEVAWPDMSATVAGPNSMPMNPAAMGAGPSAMPINPAAMGAGPGSMPMRPGGMPTRPGGMGVRPGGMAVRTGGTVGLSGSN